MVRFIVGEKGKGKTKYLLDQVNMDVKKSSGNLIFIDKSTKHIHDLSNKVRLINATEYDIKNSDEFIGFLLGLISGNYDIEEMFFDSYLDISKIYDEDMTDNLERIEEISKKFNINFTISISCNEARINEKFKSNIIVNL